MHSTGGQQQQLGMGLRWGWNLKEVSNNGLTRNWEGFTRESTESSSREPEAGLCQMRHFKLGDWEGIALGGSWVWYSDEVVSFTLVSFKNCRSKVDNSNSWGWD